MTSLLFVLAIIAGFAVLIWGADRFVDGAANIATNFGVPPLIVGLTIVGFGTSAPEMLVSALAAYEGASALGIGNAIGSNITNIGLVLGITLLVSPLIVNSQTLRREFPVLFIIMLLSAWLMWDGYLSRGDGVILFSGFLLILVLMAWLAYHSSQDDPLGKELEQEFSEPTLTPRKATLYFIIGLIALLIGSKLLVWGATGIAHLLGISDLIIGLTIVAIGTSLPELAASVVSVLKNEHDIAVGNILGSNIFNLLAVLAMPGLISPSSTDPFILLRDFPVMIGFTVALFLFTVLGKKGHLGRFTGFLMLVGYLGYTGLLAYQTSTLG